MITAPEWYVFGDSHSWVFTQTDDHPKWFPVQTPVLSRDGRFRVTRLGPWLANSLGKKEKQDVLREALSSVPEGSKVIFSFGEIDCRCHVVPEAKASGRSIRQVCEDIAATYLSSVNKLARPDLRVYIWNAPPLTGGPCYNQEYPIRGTYEECREAIECLNSCLKESCERIGAKFIDIYQFLVDGDKTRTECFRDHIHLSPAAVWPRIEEVLKCAG